MFNNRTGYNSGYKRDGVCTGVTYTNPQVREDPGFSLQSAGFRDPALIRSVDIEVLIDIILVFPKLFLVEIV